MEMEGGMKKTEEVRTKEKGFAAVHEKGRKTRETERRKFVELWK